MLLYQILACTTHGKMLKKLYKINRFKTLAPTCNEKFDIPVRSYSVSDVKDSFEYILKTQRKD